MEEDMVVTIDRGHKCLLQYIGAGDILNLAEVMDLALLGRKWIPICFMISCWLPESLHQSMNPKSLEEKKKEKKKTSSRTRDLEHAR